MGAPDTAGRLALRLAGDGEAPLLLLHGLGADHAQPLALIEPAVLRRCRVLAPDLRAHGETALDHSAGLMNFPQLADDVEDTVTGLCAGQPTIAVGISMGAAVALQLLARGKIDLRGLVLIRPAWRWEPSPPNLALFPRMAELLRTCGAVRGRAAFRDSEDYQDVASVSVRAADALLGQFDAPLAVERAGRLSALPASAPARPASRLPAVVIGTPADPVHPLATAEQVALDLGAPLQVVSPRYDAPSQHSAEVAHAIRSFVRDALSRVRGRPRVRRRPRSPLPPRHRRSRPTARSRPSPASPRARHPHQRRAAGLR